MAGASGEAHIGAGEAFLELISGGDLRLEVIGRGSAGLTEEWRQDLEARIEAEVEAALSEIEHSQQLTGSLTRGYCRAHPLVDGAGTPAVSTLGRGADRPREVNVTLGGAAETGSEIGDEERLAVLKMVEAGTLTVEQARAAVPGDGGRDDRRRPCTMPAGAGERLAPRRSPPGYGRRGTRGADGLRRAARCLRPADAA